jgi:hypothetical protein
MNWPQTKEQAIETSHRIARRGRDAIVVTTDLPHIFDCFTARQAPVFAENPHYNIVYYALARLAAPAPTGPSPPCRRRLSGCGGVG